jgi:hypothetical protein
MDIIRNLHKEILLKYRNEQLDLNLEMINRERDELNNKLIDLLHKDKHIINKYYINQKGGMPDGLKQEDIDKFSELKTILEGINQINPDQIKEKVDDIKQKTDKLVEQIDTLPKIDNISIMFDKIPQNLSVIQSHLTNGTIKNQIDIAKKVRELKVPFKSNLTEELINTKQLNEKLEEINKSYETLKSQIASSTQQDQQQFETNINELETKIKEYMKKLTEIKNQLDGVNAQLLVKNNEFANLSKPEITRDKLVFVNVSLPYLQETFKTDFTKYLQQNPANPFQGIKEKLNSLDKKNIIDFIKEYNNISSKIQNFNFDDSGNQKTLPKKLYIGSDTKSISNYIIKSDATTPTQIMKSVSDLLKIKSDEYLNGESIKPTKFEEIYNPTFAGGAKSIEDIKSLINELDTTSKQYMRVYKGYVKNTQKFNKYTIYEITHSVYLLSILSNSLFVKSGYQVYKYIGRGMINFYKRIIDKIYKDLHRDINSFTQSEESLKVLTQEIRKKYFLTISILRGFLSNLSQILTPSDIIDIDECPSEVLQYFTLLNHFKNILEKYNETQMNKLTIFSRVNDIRMNLDLNANNEMLTLDLPKYKHPDEDEYNKFKSNNPEKQKYIERLEYNINNKLFLSDYLRRNIYAGYYIKTNVYDDNINLFDISKNKLLKTELRKFKEIDVNSSGDKIYDAELYKSYLKIKEIFDKNVDNTYTQNDKIEELEKYKKETLSILVSDKFNKNKVKSDKLIKLKQQISNLEIEFADLITQIEDTVENPGADSTNKKTQINGYIPKLETKNTELYNIKQKLNTPEFSETAIINTTNDIEIINLVMRIALEYLYATSDDINEKLMWLRNITCDAHKTADCTQNLNPYDEISSDTVNKPKSCELPENIPYLNSYKFTEVFDTQNFVNNSDMAAYMCLNTRLSGGNGVCLITYGYSGTGKSYTLFGGPGKDGLLQGTLSKLDGLEKVYFRTFEIYGKGLPYVDYWYNSDGTTQKNNKIYNYLYAYKLKAEDPKTFSEGIKVDKPKTNSKYNRKEDEWAVELEGDQINNYINKINDLRENIINNNQSKTTSFKKEEENKEDILDYLEISNTSYQDLFRNFSEFTDKIEEMRIRTQRVRETPNNKVSSRSILIYDFVVVINKDDKKIPVNLLIIDLPGREEIAPTFINKYTLLTDAEKKKENSDDESLCGIIKKEFLKEYNKDKEDKEDIHKKLFKNIQNPEDVYIKELRAMLCAFTLNPLCVPLFATEIIEEYIQTNYKKIKPIMEEKIKIKYKLYGEINGIYKGNTLDISGVEFSLLDEFYTQNYNEKIMLTVKKFSPFVNDSGETIDPTNEYSTSFKFSQDVIEYKLGWYTFRNLLYIDDKGKIKIYNDIEENLNSTSKLQDINKKLYDNAIYSKKETHKITGNVNQTGNKGKFSKTSYRNPYGLENNIYNGRQIKTLLFTNLIRRIIQLQKFDILNDLFQNIIDNKINKYIRNYIDNKTDDECFKLIDNLIKNNFKRDALKEKFYEEDKETKKEKRRDIKDGNITVDINKLGDNLQKNNKTTQFTKENKENKNFKNYLYESIKYDFYTTGFEGIYINENIIGLIKYLGKDGKEIKDESENITMLYLIQSETDRDMIEIQNQDENNTINIGISKSHMLNISRLDKERYFLPSLTGSSTKTESAELPNYTDLYENNTKENTKENTKKNTKENTKENTQEYTKFLTEYKGKLETYITSTSAGGFSGEVVINRAGGKIAIMYPQALKYDDNTKMKILHINKQNFMPSLFTKNDIDKKIEKPEKYNIVITPQTVKSTEQGGTGLKTPGFITDPSGHLNYVYNPDALDEFFDKTIKSYESKKIFCFDNPIIKTILNPYLDIIGDFKIFYLFGNYEKPMRELKCAQQYELLETTNNFIEAITR